MKLGFIGLGTMGAAMAMNILRAGHEVVVWNRSREATKPLADAGATVAEDPAEALQGEAALSMLANEAAIRAVGLDGPLLDKARPGLVHALVSTVSPALARELAEAHAARGLGFVSSPVLGRADKALAGTLTVIVAGAADAVAGVRPLHEAMGSKVVTVGDKPEHANLMKVATNFMMAAAIEAQGEAFALVRKAGLDAQTFYEITEDQFQGPIYRGYGRLIVNQTYTPPGFTLRLGLKDVDLALSSAAELKVPMPFASLLHDQFVQALAHGMDELDWVAVAEVVAARAGLPSLMKPKG
jgi:3-hydroxyisobutyrate dehydrogenase-like beta-hydroxyacid dehydrogenase